MSLFATRRSLLAGLAASSIAATAAGSAQATSNPENPKLVELGEKLSPISESHVRARKARLDCYHATMKDWPKPHESITSWQKVAFSSLEYEYDVEGRSISLKCPDRGTRRIYSSEGLERQIASTKDTIARAERRKIKAKNYAERDRRWKDEIRDYKAKLRHAQTYERECQRLKRASGIEALSDDESAAREALSDHITAIMKEPSRTMLGVLIKAQALECWTKTSPFMQQVNPRGDLWARSMSTAVIEQAEAG